MSEAHSLSELNFRLSSPAAYWMLLTLVCLLIAGAAHSYWLTRLAAIESTFKEGLHEVSTHQIQQIDQWLRERRGDALTLFDSHLGQGLQPFLSNPELPDLRKATAHWLQSLIEHYGYDQVVILDRQAQPLLQLSRQDGQGDTLSDPARAWVEQALGSRRVAFSNLYIDTAPRLDYVIPLRVHNRPDAESIGALLLRIDPREVLFALLEGWMAPGAVIQIETQTVLVLAEDHEAVYLNELHVKGDIRDAPAFVRRPLDTPDLLAAKALKGEQGEHFGLDHRGQEVLASLRTVPGTRWYLITSVEARQLERALQASTVNIVFVSVLLMLVAVLVLGQIWRRRIEYRQKCLRADLMTMVSQRTYALKASNDRLRQEMAERQKVEVRLRASEQRFRDLVESSGNWIWEMDRDLTYTYASPRVRHLLGHKAQEVIGRRLTDFLAGSEAERMRETLGILISSAQPFSALEATARRRDGCAVILDIAGVPYFSAEGQLLGYRGVSRDITRRKEAESRLQKAQARLEHVIGASPALIYAVNLNPRQITFLSDHILAMTGFTRQDLIREPDLWERNLHPQDRKSVLAAQRRLLRKGRLEQEYRFRCRDGTYRWIHDQVVVIADAQGRPEELVGSWLDVTDRRQAEESLRINEANYRTLADTAMAGIFVIQDGRFSYVNPAFAHSLGYQPQEMIGLLSPEDLVVQEQRQQAVGRIRERLEGKPGEQFEYRCLHRDGHTFPILAQTCAAQYQDQPAVVGTMVDLSERKRLEGQLLQAQKLESIGQLAAGIAHEINTPIQYISDNAYFLEEAFEDVLELLAECEALPGRIQATQASLPPALRPLLENVQSLIAQADVDYLREDIPRAIRHSREGLGHVSRIIQAMKQFAHPGGDNKTAADLNQALTSATEVSRNEWKYVAQLDLKLDPGLPPVPCLPGQINQVLLNLIINAAHAIAAKMGDTPEILGRITLTTRQTASWAEIRITDTGTGIDESIRSRIFDPFFTTKEVGQGTGQGLSIAYDTVVNKHHGEIFLETQEGVGTTFIVRLPLLEGTSPHEQSTPALY